MSVAVKVVNFVLVRGFNHRQFRDLLMEADAQYGDLLYYCEVRWLSRGRMLEYIENENAPKVESYLAKVKAMRKVASKIIQFLAHLEDFQKKLWLKKKFVLETHYCILQKEVSSFLCSKGADFPEFNDPGWLCDLAFPTDITSHLNDLNVQLQGKDILMPDMVSRITTFEVKLRLWESQLMKSDFTHFKRLRACSPENVSVHVGIVT